MAGISAHNPISYLYNTVPLLKLCGSGNIPSNCACTDPSYNYGTKCALGSVNATDSRKQCAFGDMGTPGIQPSTGGGLASVKNLNYTVKPNSGSRVAFGTASGPTAGNGAGAAYPNSLLFCANPTGNATPTAPETNITVGANGTLSDWGASNPATSQTNIGFN